MFILELLFRAFSYTYVYGYFLRSYDVPGYILEKNTSDAKVLQIYAQNEIVQDVAQRLDKFKGVDPRLREATEKKQALAKAFVERAGERIFNSFKQVFFESGSTVNYIAKQFAVAGKLPKRGDSNFRHSIREVITNNAFAYLYLWLCAGVMCHPVPEGPPDDDYGGLYGPLLDRQREPDYALPPLAEFDPDVPSIIEELSKHIFGSDDKTRRPSIILAAASGVQLSEKIKAIDPVTHERITDQRIIKLLKRCRGFHTGSYQNKLFKRCYFLTKIPTIVFVHDSKIDLPIKVGKCHFQCDRQETWDSFVSSYPLSIWTVCDSNTYPEVLRKFKTYVGSGRWVFSVYGQASKYPIVIGTSAAFRDACLAWGIHWE